MTDDGDSNDTGSGRRFTSPHGIPVVAIDRLSRPVRAVESADAVDALDVRFDHRFWALFPGAFEAQLKEATDRRFTRLWRFIVGIAGVALGALAAAGKSALDDARAEGAAQLRLQIIERDAERAASDARAVHERLRDEIDNVRAEIYYRPSQSRRRDEQPDLPTTGASSRKVP